MKKVLRKRNLVAGILILVVVCLGIVFAGDVIVKQGTLTAENVDATNLNAGNVDVTGTTESEIFKSTGCTATGTRAVALGYETEASGPYSMAIGRGTTASGYYSTAMGYDTGASGTCSTAMGFLTFAAGEYSTTMGYLTGVAGSANYSTAIGRNFVNNFQDSFAVGFGQTDFSVETGEVYVRGKLTVHGDIDPRTLEVQLQERNGVIERYEKYVTPDKKSGVVYINSETKQIEIYYPFEGVIRNILGEKIYTLPSIRINNNYETYYVFDTLVGQVVKKQRAVYDKYRIKEGIEFDSTTGQFTDMTTKEVVPKEEATELYR